MQLHPYSERKVGRAPMATDRAYAARLGIVESSDGSCRRKVATDHCGGRHGRLRSG